MFDLTGKVAVVTGSSRGIGRSIAECMARAGAKVVVSSRKLDACQQVVDAIGAQGGEAVAQACNVSDKTQLQGLVDAAVQTWGRLDVLVCNAAVNPYFGPMQTMPEDAYDKIMQCNVKANYLLCNMAVPRMAEGGGGSILIVSSIGGNHGSDTLGVYGISKAADFALTRNLAIEHGPKGIRANCIAPGLIKTDFSRALWQNAELLKRVEKGTPARRMGEPDDIGGVAVFLASRAAAYVTGQTLIVDGGLSVREPG